MQPQKTQCKHSVCRMSRKGEMSKYGKDLKEKLQKWRSTLDDVYALHEKNVVRKSERMYKNGWGCISDTDIENIVSCKPRSIEELKTVPGIGKVKTEKYGDSILEVLDQFFNSLASRQD